MDSNANGGFDFNEVIGNERVKVKAPDGAFPAGTKMKISSVNDAEELAKVAAALDSSKLHTFFALDISFWYGGAEIEPEIPVEVTWESANIDSDDCRLMHLDNNGKVEDVKDAAISSDKAVFTAASFSTYILVGTERQSTVPFVRNGVTNIEFNPSGISDMAEIPSGEVAKNVPEIEGYTFDKATVALGDGRVDEVIEVGAFIANYEDDEDPENTKQEYHVFYRTPKSLEASDIIVLLAKDIIKLNYIKTPYKVTYKIVYNGTTYTVGTDTLPAELNDLELTGPDSVAENTTYSQAVRLSLPRGYSATLRMSNENSVQEPRLGEYSEPTYYSELRGYTITPDTYPFTINGLYTIANVRDDLTVTVNLSKRTSYKFSAAEALRTIYFYGATSEPYRRYKNVTPGQTFTFNSNNTTFSFTTNNTGRIEWVMDSFNINNQPIRVPFVSTTHRTDTVRTTLESGTVITMTATLGSDNKERTYKVDVSNCYENITITGGNLHNINDKREWVVQETANLAEFDYLADRWLPLVPGEPESYAQNTNGSFKPRVIRFKVKEGYVNPQIKYVDQNGTDLYQRVQGLTLQSSATEQYHLVTGGGPDSDGYYYFNLSYRSTDPDPGLLSVRAELARYGVRYNPGSVSGANMPAFDNGGTYGNGDLRGYNIEDNNMIAISKVVPSDPSDVYVFQNYTIAADAGQTPYAPSQKVPLEEVSKYAEYDSSKGEYVIPLVANWVKKDAASTVTVTVNFYLDTEFNRKVDIQVTKNSCVYIDIDSDEMISFMEDYNWQVFFDEVGSAPYIADADEDKTINLQCYSKFYVYHSATDKLVLHTTKELLKNNSIGTLDITALTTSGYYYGGYYKDYLGAHVGNTADGQNKVKIAADNDNAEGTLDPSESVALSQGRGVTIAENVAATKYNPVSNEAHLAYWTRANVFMTALKKSDTNWFGDRGSKDTTVLTTGGRGASVKVARAGIYYLHEVPSAYLATPKVATVRDNYGNGNITKMFLLSVVDISIFKAGGVKVINTDTKGAFAKTFTLTQYDEVLGKVTANEAKTSSDLFNVKGYLTVTDGTSCKANGTYTLDPYWITYDGVTVHGSDVVAGHAKTITVSNNVVS